MSYTLEKIYEEAGRDDRVALVYFYDNSDLYKTYGEFVTVVFEYNQFERMELEKNFIDGKVGKTFGKIKMRFLTDRKESGEEIKNLKSVGVDSDQIKLVKPSWENENLYHKKHTRSIRQTIIPIKKAPRGGDYNWMYGFTKKRVEQGIGLTPDEREEYLAMKFFFEKENLTHYERNEIYDGNVLRQSIEQKYLDIKFECELTNSEEEERWHVLTMAIINNNVNILREELAKSGETFKKLFEKNQSLHNGLIHVAGRFTERRLNVMGKKAVYLDIESFLHVFLRHVKEFNATDQFNNKTKFYWNPEDVIMVIKKVIESVDEEIQAYWEKTPNIQFSKYGKQALYFEGDYYEFHVEGNGRLSTFYRTEPVIKI